MQLYSGVYAQGLVKFDKESDVLSSSLQGLTLSLIGVWTLIYLITYRFWNGLLGLTTVQILAMLTMIWATAAFNFWATEQRVRLKYVQLIIITLTVSFLKPLIGILFILNATDKVTAYILGLALVELMGYSMLFVVQLRHGKKFFDARFWKYSILFNLPLIPHYLSQTVLNSADSIMIKNMIGNAEAGLYGLAYSVSLVMTLFNTALMQTISPWMYQKMRDHQTKDIAPIAYSSLCLIAGVNILLILFAPELVRLFAPVEYHDAIWVIPPIAMSVYFMYAYDLFAKFAFYYEKTFFIMIASIVAAVLNIGLNFIFIRIYGYYTAGYTTLLCYAVYAIIHYAFMRKVCRQNIKSERIYDTRVLMKITVTFILFGFLGLAMYRSLILRYCFICMLAVVCLKKKNQMSDLINSILSRYASK